MLFLPEKEFKPVVNWSAIDALIVELCEDDVAEAQSVAAGVDTVALVGTVVAVGPAVATLLGSDTLLLVLTLPRSITVARCASEVNVSFTFSLFLFISR